MEIIKARPEHIDDIVRLCAAHAAYEKMDYDPDGKREKLSKYFFERGSEVQCILVRNENRILGYASYFKQFSTWDAEYYIYMDCIYLDEEARGFGIGLKLMEYIKVYGKSNDCSIIQWQTPIFNQRAISFYKRLGATHLEKLRFFWKI